MSAGWYRVHGTHTRCGCCTLPIAEGTPARRTVNGLVRCDACALRLFGETPPDLPPLVTSPPSPPAPGAWRPLQPFVERLRRSLDATQQGSLLDTKQAATGEPHD